jgi:glutamate-1-semialdehyde 2,1-aminomutase
MARLESESKSLFERSLNVAPGGVHSPVRAFKSVGGTPIFFRKGKGAILTSVEGQDYVDFCQSFGPLILGHGDPDVLNAVRGALENGWTFGACEPYSLELAEWIVANVKHVEKLRFVCSGTEAVMSALRVARAATGRSKVLKFEGCYHGHADGLLVKAGSGLAGESASDSAGVGIGLAHDTLVARLDDEASVSAVFERHGKEIAAVILEPLPANYGLLPQREEFLRHVVDEAKRVGALVVFDEVISGFRIGLGGMAEKLGIVPDLVTYGKIIGGGFPVGAYGGRKDLLDMVAPSGPVYQAGTLSANPVGMLAGLATLRKMKDGGVHAILATRTEHFVSRLNRVFEEMKAPFAVNRQDSLFWVHPSEKPGEATGARAIESLPKDLNSRYAPFFKALLDEGVYLPPSGYEVGFLGLAHDEAVLDSTVLKFEAALKALAGVGKGK